MRMTNTAAALVAAVSGSAYAYAPKPMDIFHEQPTRSHTGIGSIEVSPKNGRLWSTCYCAPFGGENHLNYVVLMTSSDGGKTWKDVLYADPDGEGPVRSFDPEVWVDADGKLVWSWTDRTCDDGFNPLDPANGTFADPKTDKLMFVRLDAENEPVGEQPEAQYACWGIMMCKPIILKDGRTLLPVAHWYQDPSACFYATTDWKTFDYVGGVSLPKERRQFDEHQVVQLEDGSLKVWIRTNHEPVESVSTDGGKTWSDPVVSPVGNPNSRLFVTKLKNGHLLMVKHGRLGEHFEQKGWLPRRELRVFISKDDGKTWEGDLLLDDRQKVSYPDGTQAPDGAVYVAYDRDRCGWKEINFAKVREEDVLAGKLVAHDSSLTNVITHHQTKPISIPAMKVLPLGAVQPRGWLRAQLEQQRDGLTGHAEELYEDIGKSDWLTGEKRGGQFAWERGPCYAKGLVALAFALDDAGLKAKAKRWVDAVIASQRGNGDFGPKNDNWWANMIALHFVRDWGEAAGDPRVVPFLMNYFRYQYLRLREYPLSKDSFWAVARGGDNLEVVIWLYRRTQNQMLATLAGMLCDQSSDWGTFYRDGGCGDLSCDGYRMHIVNFMQGLKQPPLKWLVRHEKNDVSDYRSYAAAFSPDGWAMRQHGRVDRMLNGTEPLSGREACQGTELCAVAERILSCRDVIAAAGWFSGCGLGMADDMESVAYNTLPSQLADDGKGLRYYTLLNQPACGMGMKLGFENNPDGNAFTPGPDSGYGCCRSNFHFAWPKFVQSMWFEGGFHLSGGLVAAAYGPCVVSNKLAVIEEAGDYPFGDTVTMKFLKTDGKEWPLHFRIPRWCEQKNVVVKLNGQDFEAKRTFIRRVWKEGDSLEFTFPGKLVVEKGVYDSVAIRRGALVYALKMDADIKTLETKSTRDGFPVREYTPKGPWNYALKLKNEKTIEARYVAPTDLSGNVFAHGRETSALKVKAYRTDYAGWGTHRPSEHFNGRAIEPPPSPVDPAKRSQVAEDITLIPMGATQIRITLFPWSK